MSSGGVNRTAVGNTSNKLVESASTGGDQFNTQLQGLLQNNAASPLASTGGTAASNYTDLATTGGYSPTQISAMKDEGSDAARSAYTTAGDDYKRAVAASGGYGPSGSTIESLARKGSEAASHAAVSTDAAIAGSQVSNKLAANAGLSNLSSLNAQQQQALLNTILGNKTATNASLNETLATQLGIAKMPGAATYVTNEANALLGI